MNKILKEILSKKLQAQGYSRYYSNIVVENRYKDLVQNKSTNLKQKIWAQRRGFYSHRIKFYGLTEENIQNYLPDFVYYKLHPINGRYNQWIDDKLIMKFMLHPFNEYLPEYYYHIGNNEILLLMDCPKGYGPSLSDIINLLKNKKVLAGKLPSGSHGKGFVKLAHENNHYFINNHLSTENEIKEFFVNRIGSKGSGYLLTEYLKPHPSLNHIWNKTPNALRVMVIRDMNQKPIITNSFIRFGTNETGVIDNSGVGGVISHVNLNTGFFTDAKIIKNFIISDMPYHPESGEIVEGVVPQWERICKEILSICNYLPQVIYFGFDIAITENGFKILEINSQQAIGFMQKYKPFFTDEVSKKFFNRLLEEKTSSVQQKRNKSFIRRFLGFVRQSLRYLLKPFRK